MDSFDACPLGWESLYIFGEEKVEHYFAQVGRLAHEVISRFYNGELEADELKEAFIAGYWTRVTARDVPLKIRSSYYKKTVAYFESHTLTRDGLVGSEVYFEGNFFGVPVIGFIDLVKRGADGMHITDYKTGEIKPLDVDKKMRQLYIYAEFARQLYGEYPKTLTLASLRGKEFTKTFDGAEFERTKNWFLGEIARIREEDEWKARPEFFKCFYLCNANTDCPYKNML